MPATVLRISCSRSLPSRPTASAASRRWLRSEVLCSCSAMRSRSRAKETLRNKQAPTSWATATAPSTQGLVDHRRLREVGRAEHEEEGEHPGRRPAAGHRVAQEDHDDQHVDRGDRGGHHVQGRAARGRAARSPATAMRPEAARDAQRQAEHQRVRASGWPGCRRPRARGSPAPRPGWRRSASRVARRARRGRRPRPAARRAPGCTRRVRPRPTIRGSRSARPARSRRRGSRPRGPGPWPPSPRVASVGRPSRHESC